MLKSKKLKERIVLKKQQCSVFKKIVSQGCLLYTGITLLLYTGGMIVSDIERAWIPTIGMMYMVLIFSLLLAAANVLVLNARFHGFIKLLLHYAVTTLVFYVVFIFWSGFYKRGASILTILLLFTFVYCICALVYCGVRYIKGSRDNKKTGYESQFSTKN